MTEPSLTSERLPGDPGEGHWARPLHDRFTVYLQARRGLTPYTVRNYLTDLAPFWRFLDDHGVREIGVVDRGLLRGYLHWLLTDARPLPGGRGPDARGRRRVRTAGYAPRSVARKLSGLRALFRFLLRDGEIAADPTALLASAKPGLRLPDFLEPDTVATLVETPVATGPPGLRDRAILETLYAAGLRVSELTGLDVADVDLERGQLRVLGKGSRQRMALLGGAARGALDAYLRDGRPKLAGRRDRGALLLNRFGGRLSQRSVQTLVRRYAIEAGLDAPVHPHTLRHTFATHLLDGGADIRVVQELLGHASPTTTQIYTHVTQATARRTYMAAHPRAREADEAPAEPSS